MSGMGARNRCLDVAAAPSTFAVVLMAGGLRRAGDDSTDDGMASLYPVAAAAAASAVADCSRMTGAALIHSLCHKHSPATALPAVTI